MIFYKMNNFCSFFDFPSPMFEVIEPSWNLKCNLPLLILMIWFVIKTILQERFFFTGYDAVAVEEHLQNNTAEGRNSLQQMGKRTEWV